MKWKQYLFISAYLIIFNMSAQQIIDLWPDGVPNSLQSDMEELTVYEGSRRISNVVNPTLEVYLPSGEQSLGIGVLVCPGGGYARLAYDKEGTDVAKYLNGQGIAAFVLKYRLPENKSNEVPHKSPLMDAERAMLVIRENAEKWNLDKMKIGVMGFSAGGHLAATLGTHFKQGTRPDFMVLIYPVVTMKEDYTHQGSRENLIGKGPSEEWVKLYSNEQQVKTNTPPTFIVHSMDDGAVPVENSLQLAKALKEQKVPLEMHVYPKGGHGYALALNEDRLSDWPLLLVNWIRDLIK